MFIRETAKINKKTGVKYISYQLVESFRTSSGPRQKILLTIDSDIHLTLIERKEVANRIEEIIKGVSSLFPCSDHVESVSQYFSKLLLQKTPLLKSIEVPNDNVCDFHNVDINNIHHTNVKSIGAEHIVHSAYQELGFDEIFDSLHFSDKQKFCAASTIMGRALYPYSERSLYHHLTKNSALDELLFSSFSKLSLDQLYSISDKLYGSKNSIEKQLRKRERSLFNLQEAIILYDITNTYFEGSCKGHPKAKRGKSKEMRTDCPLISVGVVLDADGFPKHSEIFEGNVNERATLQEMILRLNQYETSVRPIVVMDSGIATKDNVEWLKSQGFNYIVMMKKKDRPSVDLCKEVVIRNTNTQFVSASLVFDKDTEDRMLWCYSEERLKKEQDIKTHKEKAVEDALKELKNGLNTPRKMKTLAKVHQKIGRLREKYARLIQHYEIVVYPTPDGINAQDITWSYNEVKVEKSFSGTYTLRTNIKDLTAEKMWEIYMMLNEAESCFRCLKSEMGLRPNWHQREERIDGHIFISLLAYHLIATVRKKLKDNGINDSWKSIRECLRNHSLVYTSLKTKEETIYLKKVSDPDEYQKTIYRALGLTSKLLKPEKIIIKTKM